MIRWVVAAVPGIALVLTLGAWASGWEGSVSKAERIAEQAVTQIEPEEFEFEGGELDTAVEAVLYDSVSNAVAVVVSVTNPDAKRPIVNAPIQIELLDAAGKVVGTNTAPGTDPILNEVPSIPPGETVLYVNDTIVPQGVPASARVKATGTPSKATLRELDVEGKIEDSVYGVSAIGSVLNPNAAALRDVRVDAVVEKAGKVVAAGQALVEQLEANTAADFQIILIGDAKGGELTLWAPSL